MITGVCKQDILGDDGYGLWQHVEHTFGTQKSGRKADSSLTFGQMLRKCVSQLRDTRFYRSISVTMHMQDPVIENV